MKHLLLLCLISIAQPAFSFYKTYHYGIFEEDDFAQAKSYLNSSRFFGGIKILPEDAFTKIKLSQIREIANEIHKAYLELYHLDESVFPRPFVIMTQGAASYNFSYIEKNKIMPSNLISIGSEHIVNLRIIYAILAHEMAHYLHQHPGKNYQFKRVSYSDDRENLGEHNDFGRAIPNNPELNHALHKISQFDQTFYQGRAKLSDLSTIEITKANPLMILVRLKYPKLFKDQPIRFDRCTPLVVHLKNLKKIKGLTEEMINKTERYEKQCALTKDKPWDYLTKNLLGSNYHRRLYQAPEKYINHPNALISESAKAKVQQTLPITSAMRIIYQQRVALKELLESIDWSRLQFFSIETEADFTSFQVLNHLQKAHYQLALLELAPEVLGKCIEALADEKKPIPYFSEKKKYDMHGSLCFRAYRTIKMLEKLSPYVQRIKVSKFIPMLD